MSLNRVSSLFTFPAQRGVQPLSWLRKIGLPPLTARAKPIYEQMMGRLQRDLLLLLTAITIPLGIVIGYSLARAVWVNHTMPAAALLAHTLSVVLSALGVSFLLRRGHIKVAWGAVLAINLSANFLQSVLLHEPGVLLFTLLVLVGPAVAAPLWFSFLLAGGAFIAFYFTAWLWFPGSIINFNQVVQLYTTILLGFMAIGVVVQRMVYRFAHVTAEVEDEALQRGKLEQKVIDLNSQMQRIASLEHDIRQPLRVVQGYLSMVELDVATEMYDELISPALAATSRAERLINNLLEQVRADANQIYIFRQPVAACTLFDRLQTVGVGLARYYTDPPVPIRFEIAGNLPDVMADGDPLERAILNLLDNALRHSPPHGVVEVRASHTATEWVLEVRDQGPGVPLEVIEALNEGEARGSAARLGSGLLQVHGLAQRHGGYLVFASSAGQTSVQIRLPLEKVAHETPGGPRH